MKICIVGAGAIGGLLAVRFGSLGHQIAVVDQGIQLQAIQQKGLALHMADGSLEHHTPWIASDSTKAIGPVDLVVLALKAHDIGSVAPIIPALYHESTAVVTLQNGIPWWYFERHRGPFENPQLGKLDPDGVIRAHIPIERVVGCIAYPAAFLAEPASIQHVEGNRFSVGEPDGTESERCLAIRDLFKAVAFKSYILTDIRSEIWLKALGAAAFNPLSALTGATMAELCQQPDSRSLLISIMKEVETVASSLGVTMRVSIEKRLVAAEAVGHHKTSMLQDREAGRTMEIDATIGSIVELARIQGISSPHLDTIYACVSLLNKGLRQR